MGALFASSAGMFLCLPKKLLVYTGHEILIGLVFVINRPGIEVGDVAFKLLGVGELSPEEMFDCVGINVAIMAFEGREPIFLKSIEVVVG